ncbi:MAG: DUF4372 domain-containing protein [Desulfobacterales bacterium]|nr:DUF4372 domain-containing protein [Desulfobacterales bacterium]
MKKFGVSGNVKWYSLCLRDIECCLRAMREKLCHMGIRGVVSTPR